jgi:uncharacterized protein (UPF0335 family)
MSIEKQSLEAHVDLCAERYSRMADRIERLESDISKRMDTLEDMLKEIKDGFNQKEASAIKTMFAVGLSAITALLGISGGLLWYIITQNT